MSDWKTAQRSKKVSDLTSDSSRNNFSEAQDSKARKWVAAALNIKGSSGGSSSLHSALVSPSSSSSLNSYAIPNPNISPSSMRNTASKMAKVEQSLQKILAIHKHFEIYAQNCEEFASELSSLFSTAGDHDTDIFVSQLTECWTKTAQIARKTSTETQAGFSEPIEQIFSSVIPRFRNSYGFVDQEQLADSFLQRFRNEMLERIAMLLYIQLNFFRNCNEIWQKNECVAPTIGNFLRETSLQLPQKSLSEFILTEAEIANLDASSQRTTSSLGDEIPLNERYIRGSLYKRGFKNQSWKQRLFQLQIEEKKIKYFKTSDYKKGESKMLGFIDLGLMLSFELVDETTQKKKYQFEVRTQTRTYYLAADSDEERLLWKKSIEMSHSAQQEKTRQNPVYLERFKQADRDGNGRVDFYKMCVLMEEMNVLLSQKEIKSRFKELDRTNSGLLDFWQFTIFMDNLKYRTEVSQIFETINNGQNIEAKKFLNWLRQVQKEQMTEEQFKDIIMLLDIPQYFPEGQVSKRISAPMLISKEIFQVYITSTMLNSLVNRALTNSVNQDMTRPLTEYWISSSHNTYLLGDQFRGESSTQAYLNAFLKGCRCIEIDCWDGPNGQPIVTHGHTLCTTILFKDVINTIRESAFKYSPYPVIISIENHCCYEQQLMMANIFKSVFGTANMLPEPFLNLTEDDVLPSPEELKYKILLKGRVISDEEALRDCDKELCNEDYDSFNKSKQSKIAPELERLIHFHSVNFRGLESRAYKPYEMLSVVETKMNEFIKQKPRELMEFLRKRLLRVYPKGLRVDSSNYLSVYMWNVGAQMIALNYQTGDQPMWLNGSRYSVNGSVGYVLKPLRLREGKLPHISYQNPDRNITIGILSCFSLPRTSRGREGISPYVKIRVYDGSLKPCKKLETSIIENNGYNPCWNEYFSFPLAYIDQAIIQLCIMDSRDITSADAFVAQLTLPAEALKEGYRTATLLDKQSTRIENATITLQISFQATKPVPAL
eukprot:TRINITY_DN2566_c0_g4_i1.p1 TRINITY_DN2566_c0_g4~~TRINITY_DN2566_c0_g4_i1.p1  ORF type:complete len:999 (+),score=364.53 TRINITY_DN2566_c0_g4_i1:27-3023(+)